MRDPVIREFFLAFWKIHILYHAAEERGVYGQWMLEELHHHGYRLSPGTLYPILSRMARRGWLRATEPKRSHAPRVYHLTPKGRELLREMERLRLILDATHLCDESFWDALDHFSGPIWASHGHTGSGGAALPTGRVEMISASVSNSSPGMALVASLCVAPQVRHHSRQRE